MESWYSRAVARTFFIIIIENTNTAARAALCYQRRLGRVCTNDSLIMFSSGLILFKNHRIRLLLTNYFLSKHAFSYDLRVYFDIIFRRAHRCSLKNKNAFEIRVVVRWTSNICFTISYPETSQRRIIPCLSFTVAEAPTRPIALLKNITIYIFLRTTFA